MNFEINLLIKSEHHIRIIVQDLGDFYKVYSASGVGWCWEATKTRFLSTASDGCGRGRHPKATPEWVYSTYKVKHVTKITIYTDMLNIYVRMTFVVESVPKKRLRITE